jgi:hypothetical protein
LQLLLVVRGSTGVTLIAMQISAYSDASRHSAVDFLVSVSAQQMKTVEPKQTALNLIERPSGVSAKSGQRAGIRSCNNATSRWFAEGRAE